MIRYALATAPAGAASQDRAAVISSDDVTLAVVADGAGGTAGGADAAELVVERVRRWTGDSRYPAAWVDLLATATRARG